jgi:uncharacterized protein YutE (UPF0331/DUF86 family)
MSLDRELIDTRLELIERMASELEGVRTRFGELGAFLADEDGPGATERRYQVALQALLDVGSHIVAVRGWRMPEGYRGVVESLALHGVLPADLGDRLAQAAGLRNRLVHGYMEVDRAVLWECIPLAAADLRAFLRAAVTWVEAAPPGA